MILAAIGGLVIASVVIFPRYVFSAISVTKPMPLSTRISLTRGYISYQHITLTFITDL